MLAIVFFSLILFTSGIVGMMPSVFAQPVAGDIIVTDDLIGIIKVDPTTGAQTIISSSCAFPPPNDVCSFTGVAIDANGDIIVGEILTGGIIKVDPTTGAQTVISSGGSLTDPQGIAIAANGDIIVANVGFPAVVIRVDPTSGAQTVISSFEPSGGAPIGIAIAANGDIIVSDSITGAITRVDPTSGTQTVISFTGSSVEAAGVSIAANGDIIAAANFPPVIVKVDPTTGIRTTISSGLPLEEAIGVAIAANGDILVSDPTALAIIKVDPTSGAQTVISSGGLFQANFWLTIYPSLVGPDNDGISDDVDLQPNTFSNDFSDVSLGGITTGTIIEREDLILTVEDDLDPANGVLITADASGSSLQAEISICGGISTVFLTQGNQLIITCGV